jgi:REP element-mobilizing transposase RayT
MEEGSQPRRKGLRLKSYDYSSNGAYFVTFCTHNRREIIGLIEKKIIEEELTGLRCRFKGLRVESLAVMKNHIHVVFFLQDSEVSLPRIVQVLKSLTTRRMRSVGHCGDKFWQRNYHEHVIRHESVLEKIREYIANNPFAEQLDYNAMYDSFPDIL